MFETIFILSNEHKKLAHHRCCLVRVYALCPVYIRWYVHLSHLLFLPDSSIEYPFLLLSRHSTESHSRPPWHVFLFPSTHWVSFPMSPPPLSPASRGLHPTVTSWSSALLSHVHPQWHHSMLVFPCPGAFLIRVLSSSLFFGANGISSLSD